MKEKYVKEKSVMKRLKQHIAMVLVLTLLVTLIPLGHVQAKSKSPEKLSAKDFVYTENGKKGAFIKQYKTSDSASYFASIDTDVKSKTKNFTFVTKRKIKLGSTESYVKKKYGKTTKVKVNGKDRFYKYIKYNVITVDTSIWKNYLEYNYKKTNY